MGLEVIAPGPILSKRKHEHKVYPYIFNSDQRSHFTSPQNTGLVEAVGSKASMEGKGKRQNIDFKKKDLYNRAIHGDIAILLK